MTEDEIYAEAFAAGVKFHKEIPHVPENRLIDKAAFEYASKNNSPDADESHVVSRFIDGYFAAMMTSR
jgi:hypothetical protein